MPRLWTRPACHPCSGLPPPAGARSAAAGGGGSGAAVGVAMMFPVLMMLRRRFASIRLVLPVMGDPVGARWGSLVGRVEG